MRGQTPLGPEKLGALPLSGDIYYCVGLTPTQLIRPTGKSGSANSLVVMVDQGSFRIKVGNFAALVVTAADFANNNLTRVAHEYETGDGPYQLTTTTALPTGLSAATDYYVIADATDPDVFQLATTKVNALAGTEIAISDAGTGTHTIDGMTMTEFPVASDASGDGGVYLGSLQSLIFPAATSVTAVGFGATDVLTYWWI